MELLDICWKYGLVRWSGEVFTDDDLLLAIGCSESGENLWLNRFPAFLTPKFAENVWPGIKLPRSLFPNVFFTAFGFFWFLSAEAGLFCPIFTSVCCKRKVALFKHSRELCDVIVPGEACFLVVSNPWLIASVFLANGTSTPSGGKFTGLVENNCAVFFDFFFRTSSSSFFFFFLGERLLDEFIDWILGRNRTSLRNRNISS